MFREKDSLTTQLRPSVEVNAVPEPKRLAELEA